MNYTQIIATVLQLSAAFMMAFVWAAFLRKLDIFKPEKWWQVGVVIALGGLTTLPVFLLDLGKTHYFNHPFLQGLVYYTLNVGLVEELSKTFGFLTLLLFFRKWFDEDVNYLVYASIIALGFATVENCMYFMKYGIHLVYIRGLMSTFVHISCTAIIGSFICMGVSKNKLLVPLYALAGIVIGTLLHGLYDAFLSVEIGFLGEITAACVFMIGIELWAQFSNNFMNRSKFYQKNMAIDRNTLQRFLFAAFILAGLIQMIGLLIKEGIANGLLKNMGMFILELLLTAILVSRITRYTVNPGHWKKIKLRLPFTRRTLPAYMKIKDPNNPNGKYVKTGEGRGFFTIRGDEFNEYPFTTRINKLVQLIPFKTPKFNDNDVYQCWIVDKIFLGKNNELYYICELAGESIVIPNAHPRHFLIKPKTTGTKRYKKWPIIGLITLPAYVDIENIQLSDARFMRWSVMKDDSNESFSQTWKEMIF